MAALTVRLVDNDTVITPVAQLSTMTISLTWAANDKMKITLTDEDGTTTQSVETTVSSSTLETCRDEHLAELQASILSLFTAITWAASGTDKITATAATSGVPFYLAASETTAGNGTWVEVETTANTGANDWNTATIWDGAAVPVDDDHVILNSGSRDIKYGLNQTAVQLKSFRVGERYKGTIGDKKNKKYLRIDVNSTAGGNTPLVSLKSGGLSVWLDGAMTSINIRGTSRDLDAVQLKGDIDNLRCSGGEISGTVTVADAAVLDNVYVNGAPGLKLKLGENITSGDLIEMDSGDVESKSTFATLNISGGKYRVTKDATCTAANVRGSGRLEYATSGTLTTLNLYDGFVDLASSEAKNCTITNCTVWSGVLDEAGAITNFAYTNDITLHGGDVRGSSGRVVKLT